jgi:type IV pilus assembly protein PilV
MIPSTIMSIKLTIRPFRGHSSKSLVLHRSSLYRGATLIEILVAVVILSFGLLGIAAMQTRALQGNQSSLQRSQAIVLNNSLMDAMRIDKASVAGGSYNITKTCGAAGVSGVTLAKENLKDWLSTAESAIGSTACGIVACDLTNNVCEIQLIWDDSKAGGLAEQVVTITSRL